ncbi:hypothetical protein SAMN04487996_104335 [Dyadobacter soli]|uniref:Uncharacterized protein n=1 Tax=Dyadobacter soli TaxID=659014 RepID=A0A1G7BX33_9BACT|nr:hypothetical protein [Dyadobacter soli]SDE31617.1 hypothetical protein SAMN04487996_104335 [Dyadobacter soli]
MKEKIRHLIALKLHKKAEFKFASSNLIVSDKLTEQAQNELLDQLRLLDEDIEILEKMLRQSK